MMYVFYILLLIAPFYSLHSYSIKKGAPETRDVVQRIKNYLPAEPIIVEGGAYDGGDAQELVKLLPQARIYTFEPVPELYEKSCAATHKYNNIAVYNCALSDETGRAIMYLSEEKQRPDIVSMSSSLLMPTGHKSLNPDTLFTKDIEVSTITLDDWTEKNNIERIDFLKLDIQGCELNVLKASPRIFNTIKAILVEVEFKEAYKDQYLFEDVKAWLEEKGFELKCLYKNGWFGDALFIRK